MAEPQIFHQKIKALRKHTDNLVASPSLDLLAGDRRHDIADEILGFATEIASYLVTSGEIQPEQFGEERNNYAGKLHEYLSSRITP